jgi:hypothetical protein
MLIRIIVYMSMHFDRQEGLPLIRRRALSRLFGRCVEATRQAGGRSIEEAAHLAGMEVSEWAAVEEGYVPAPSQLRPMADSLEIGHDKLAVLAIMCRGAGEL